MHLWYIKRRSVLQERLSVDKTGLDGYVIEEDEEWGVYSVNCPFK